MNRLNNISGGALLFAIITSFVLAMIGAALVLLTSNQYKLINDEIERKNAYYWLKAGMEYANYKLRTDPAGVQSGQEFSLLEKSEIKIKITKLPSGSISDYQIETYTKYTE